MVPYVEAELNRRFPGRAERRAEDPDGLRAAWVALERTWRATLARVAGMPAGAVDVSVDGEWSFAQTLRHLVMATVLEVRASRVAMVRGFLATVTRDDLAASRQNPHDPDHQESVLSCLYTILEEEWEHHRHAVRDLDAIESTAGGHQ